MKISAGTIARTVCLALALANQILVLSGKEMLPFADDAVYQAVSTGFMAISAIAAWWKNNSFTTPAIMADEILKEERAKMSENQN